MWCGKGPHCGSGVIEQWQGHPGLPSTPWASSFPVCSPLVYFSFPLLSFCHPCQHVLPFFPISAVLWNIRSFKAIYFMLRLETWSKPNSDLSMLGFTVGRDGGWHCWISGIGPATPFSPGQKWNRGCKSSLEVQPEFGPLVIWVISESKILLFG